MPSPERSRPQPVSEDVVAGTGSLPPSEELEGPPRLRSGRARGRSQFGVRARPSRAPGPEARCPRRGGADGRASLGWSRAEPSGHRSEGSTSPPRTLTHTGGTAGWGEAAAKTGYPPGGKVPDSWAPSLVPGLPRPGAQPSPQARSIRNRDSASGFCFLPVLPRLYRHCYGSHLMNATENG